MILRLFLWFECALFNVDFQKNFLEKLLNLNKAANDSQLYFCWAQDVDRLYDLSISKFLAMAPVINMIIS